MTNGGAGVLRGWGGEQVYIHDIWNRTGCRGGEVERINCKQKASRHKKIYTKLHSNYKDLNQIQKKI